MGSALSKGLSYDPQFYFSPEDKIYSDEAFEFCRGWTLAKVHDAAQTFLEVAGIQLNDAPTGLLELYQEKVEQIGLAISQYRKDIIEERVRYKQMLSASSEFELDENDREVALRIDELIEQVVAFNPVSELLSPVEDESILEYRKWTKKRPLMSPIADCMQRQIELLKEDLELYKSNIQREMGSYRPETGGLENQVTWTRYLNSLKAMKEKELHQEETNEHEVNHSALQGFTLTRNQNYYDELERYYKDVKEQEEKKTIAAHHTDDSASDSGEDEVQDDVEMDDDGNPIKKTTEPEIIINVPEPFDATLRSPVYFGSTYEHWKDPILAARKKEAEDSDRETTILQRKLEEIALDTQTRLDAAMVKIQALEARKKQTRSKRQKDREKRRADTKVALNEINEKEKVDFMRKVEKANEKFEKQALDEEQELDRQHGVLDQVVERERRNLDAKSKKLKNAMNYSTPKAKLRIKFHKTEMKRYVKMLEDAKQNLTEASESLAATMAIHRRRAANPKSRSQILYAEGQVRAREADVSQLSQPLIDEEFLLSRALASQESENMYRPLYDALQDDKSLPHNGFKLKDLLFFYITGSKSELREKLSYCFFMFCHSKTNMLEAHAFISILKGLYSLLEKIRGYHAVERLENAEYNSIAARAYTSRMAHGALSEFDFIEWSLSSLTKSRCLSELLRIPWKLKHLSRYQCQHMSPGHQYAIGLLSHKDMQLRILNQASTFRAELDPSHMEEIHDRAIAMGYNDPLKTDYTRFMPKRGQKLHSNVVPLDNGCYTNLKYWNSAIENESATLIQTQWRAKQARALFKRKMKMHAFYYMKAVELVNTKDRIVDEWKEKRMLTGVAKIKFDAKVRLRQVKIRSTGAVLTPDQVLLVMMDEDVQLGLRQTELRFQEMECEMEYIDLITDGVSDGPDELVSRIKQQLQDARKRPSKILELLEQIELKSKEKTLDVKSDANKNLDNQKVDVYAAPVMTSLVDPESKLEKLDSLTGLRRKHLLLGERPEKLYKTGETFEEREIRQDLSMPSVTYWSLFSRIQHVTTNMTNLKTREFLMELPSKQLLCAYAACFRERSFPTNLYQLAQDLHDHFGILKDTEKLARWILNVQQTDLEEGILNACVQRWNNSEESELYKFTLKMHNLNASDAEAITVKRNLGKSQDKIEADKYVIEKELATQKQKTLSMKVAAATAYREWKLSQLSLQEMCRRNTKREPSPNTPCLTQRIDWYGRMSNILADIKQADNMEENISANKELSNLITDFLGIAADVATRIISEYYLPPHLKSVQPSMTEKIDGRNDEVRNGGRQVYEFYNIRFKLAVDDHGMYDGSNEAAAKACGNSIRGSSSYFTCAVFKSLKFRMPLQTIVDFHGFRVICSSKVPIDHIIFNEKGDVRQMTQRHVYGTIDRGKHVICTDKKFIEELTTASQELNLAVHSVKGSLDLTARTIPTAGDMKGYIVDNDNYALFHFHRSMPPEDPNVMTHLGSSLRGQTILWRLLRPEFVRMTPFPLSPDGLSLLIRNTADCEIQVSNIEKASKILIDDVIPAFAASILAKVQCTHDSKERTEKASSAVIKLHEIQLSEEMHRNGINIRHLSAIRNKFAVWVEGTCTLRFNHKEILTTTNFAEQVARGTAVELLNEQYTISTDMADAHEYHAISLDRAYTGNSLQNIPMLAGTIGKNCVACSREIRMLLLCEMVVRTLKQILRKQLRILLKENGILLPQRHRQVVISFFNLLTGEANATESKSFWYNDLFLGIRSRFGRGAVTFVDREEIRLLFQGHWLVHVINRLSNMMGILWAASSKIRFHKQPDAFSFQNDDLEFIKPRTRHNAETILSSSNARILYVLATARQKMTYEAVVRADQAAGHWPLNERKGSCIAKNLGFTNRSFQGAYKGGVQFEISTTIRNDALHRGVHFQRGENCYIMIKPPSKYYPNDVETHISMEAWVQSEVPEDTLRVILSFGRYSLVVLKNQKFGFIANVQQADILVEAKLADSAGSKWQHVVGTCDGTNLNVYVNGHLCGTVDIVSKIALQLRIQASEYERKNEQIDRREEVAKGICWRKIEDMAVAHFETPKGADELKKLAKKLQDEFSFQQRLLEKNSKGSNNGKAGATKKVMGKKEAFLVARKKYVKDRYEIQAEDIESEFDDIREALAAKALEEEQESIECTKRPLRIGCMASKRHRGGRFFFIGSIAHLAYYETCLPHDTIMRHYLAGTMDRAEESNVKFGLAKKYFSTALSYDPKNLSFMQDYAQTVCKSLEYDLDLNSNQEVYKHKVSEAIKAFSPSKNVRAVAEIIRSLPDESTYATLFAQAFTTILFMDSSFFDNNDEFSLDELAIWPRKFSLGRQAISTPEVVSAHASVIKLILNKDPAYFGEKKDNMKWLCSIRTSSVIVKTIIRLEDEDDTRLVDLSKCTDVIDEDIEVLTNNNRQCTEFKASGCALLSSKAAQYVSNRCKEIRRINFSNCVKMNDASLLTFCNGNSNSLTHIRIERCHLISDDSISTILTNSSNLVEFNARYCDQISDDALQDIGKHCQKILHIDVGYCFNISDLGLRGFSIQTAGDIEKLDFTSCHRITDLGIQPLAKKCVKLKILNLQGCDKISNIGALSITHNCTQLVELNFQNLHQVSNKPFFFDMEDDGRPIVDQNMLKSLVLLDVTNCKDISDDGVGEICHRVSTLESLSISGCLAVTDQGIQWINSNRYNGCTICESLTHLDVSFCSKLTDTALNCISSSCRKLRSIYLSGCTQLTSLGVQSLIQSCPNIQDLRLGFCKAVDDRVLETMVTHLWIEKLVLTRCTKITDEGMRSICAEFSGLELLDISWCKKLGDKSLKYISEGCPHLKSVNIEHCPLFSSYGIQQFGNHHNVK